MFTAFTNRFWKTANAQQPNTNDEINHTPQEQEIQLYSPFCPQSFFLRNQPVPPTTNFPETIYSDDDDTINDDQIQQGYLSFPQHPKTLIWKTNPIPSPQLDLPTQNPQPNWNDTDDSDFDTNYQYESNFQYAGYLSFPKPNNFSTEVQTSGQNTFYRNQSNNSGQYSPFSQNAPLFPRRENIDESKKKAVQFTANRTRQDISLDPSTPPKSILKKTFATIETSPIPNQMTFLPDQNPPMNQFNEMPNSFHSQPNQFNEMPNSFNPPMNQFNEMPNSFNPPMNQFNEMPNSFNSQPNQFNEMPVPSDFFPNSEQNNYQNDAVENPSNMQQMSFTSLHLPYDYQNQQAQDRPFYNDQGIDYNQNEQEKDFMIIHNPQFQPSGDLGYGQDDNFEIKSMINNVGTLFSTPKSVPKIQHNQNDNHPGSFFRPNNQNGQSRKPLDVISNSFFNPS